MASAPKKLSTFQKFAKAASLPRTMTGGGMRQIFVLAHVAPAEWVKHYTELKTVERPLPNRTVSQVDAFVQDSLHGESQNPDVSTAEYHARRWDVVMRMIAEYNPSISSLTHANLSSFLSQHPDLASFIKLIEECQGQDSTVSGWAPMDAIRAYLTFYNDSYLALWANVLNGHKLRVGTKKRLAEYREKNPACSASVLQFVLSGIE